jgi:hypothetical protein
MTTISPRVQAAVSSAGKYQFGVFRRYELARMETLNNDSSLWHMGAAKATHPTPSCTSNFSCGVFEILSLRRVFKEFGALYLRSMNQNPGACKYSNYCGLCYSIICANF